MVSVLFLEQPGRWRAVVTATLLLLVALPVVPLARAALDVATADAGLAFWQGVQTSVTIAVVAALLGFALGLPVGVGTGLSGFRGRPLVLAAVGLPLLAPSFLWAIGWSTLSLHSALVRACTAGISGCVLIGATTTTALVVFASYAATLELSRSQIDAVLLTGGYGALLRRACRHAILPAAFGAALGGVMVLSDPGAGQILGVHSAAQEILTTFAVRYDLALAAVQCSILAALVMAVAFPLAWIAAPWLVEAVSARQYTQAPRPGQRTTSIVVASMTCAYVLLFVAPPIAGLVTPLVRGNGALASDVGRWFSIPSTAGDHVALALLGALGTAARTAWNSIVYAGGAAALAVLLGATLAVAVGRATSLRTVTMSVGILLFSWPSFAVALGVARVASAAPPVFDALLRSRFTVCAVLASHLAPIAIALALRANGAIAPSLTFASAVHGVPIGRHLRLVLWPALRPSVALSFALVALLASADAGTVLLLHPPGEASLSLALFTIMANAPEAEVAALCLVHLFATITVVAALVGLGLRRAT